MAAHPEMTYTVLSGMLNSTMPCHAMPIPITIDDLEWPRKVGCRGPTFMVSVCICLYHFDHHHQ